MWKTYFLLNRVSITHNSHKIGHCLTCTLYTSVAEWECAPFSFRLLEINWLSLIEMWSPFLAPPSQDYWIPNETKKKVEYRDSHKWNHLIAVDAISGNYAETRLMNNFAYWQTVLSIRAYGRFQRLIGAFLLWRFYLNSDASLQRVHQFFYHATNLDAFFFS